MFYISFNYKNMNADSLKARVISLILYGMRTSLQHATRIDTMSTSINHFSMYFICV